MTIAIANLQKTYGRGARAVHALSDISLSIGRGMFGLLGPNGAGKTTLMRILSGITRPTAGEVTVGGHSLSVESGRVAVKDRLGYLPQELGVYPELAARQFLDYMGILKRLARAADRRRRVEATLEATGLSEVADRKLKTFSGGMKRRVGIAQALLNDPAVLIVDEPTAGLDPEERIRFRNLLVDLARDRVVILSTHIVEDISQTCSDLAVLDRGRLRFRGSPTELLARAQGVAWEIHARDGVKPNGGLVVVSTLHLADGVRYRVVGEDVSRHPDAKAVPPSLEDGYVWLMHQPA